MLATASGIAAHFFSERQPLLVPTSVAVVMASYALSGGLPFRRALAVSVGVGFALWGFEQAVYAVVHVASGEEFTADRFGPQWSQALLLILAHATLIGVPSGVVAALLLRMPPLRRSPESSVDAV